MSSFDFCPLCKAHLRRRQIDGRRRLICSSCGWIHYENPFPVAVCVARNKKGEILITRRNLAPGKNKWALPGGFIESGEDPEETCLRELREETGLDGKIVGLIGVYIQRTGRYGNLLIVGYAVKVFGEEISVNHELKEAKFVNRRQLPFIPFSTHRIMIKEVFKKL